MDLFLAVGHVAAGLWKNITVAFPAWRRFGAGRRSDWATKYGIICCFVINNSTVSLSLVTLSVVKYPTASMSRSQRNPLQRAAFEHTANFGF